MIFRKNIIDIKSHGPKRMPTESRHIPTHLAADSHRTSMKDDQTFGSFILIQRNQTETPPDPISLKYGHRLVHRPFIPFSELTPQSWQNQVEVLIAIGSEMYAINIISQSL